MRVEGDFVLQAVRKTAANASPFANRGSREIIEEMGAKFLRAIKYFFFTCFCIGILSFVGLSIVWRYGLQIANEKIEKQGLEFCGLSLGEREIPISIVAATISQEDFHFFSHQGVDWPEFLVSAFRNLSHFEIIRGGSTISMQVARLCYLANEDRGLKRKLLEMTIAAQLHQKYPREEILRAYLTKVPMSPDGKVEGFADASMYYYGKGLHELNRQEVWALVLTLRNREHLNPNETQKGEKLSESIRQSLEGAKGRARRLAAWIVYFAGPYKYIDWGLDRSTAENK